MGRPSRPLLLSQRFLRGSIQLGKGNPRLEIPLGARRAILGRFPAATSKTAPGLHEPVQKGAQEGEATINGGPFADVTQTTPRIFSSERRTRLRKIVKFGEAMLLHVVAPDEAELGGKPSWQLLIEGTGDPWDSSVGHFFSPEISCSGLCNVVKGELVRAFPFDLVQDWWREFEPELVAFYLEYQKHVQECMTLAGRFA